MARTSGADPDGDGTAATNHGGPELGTLPHVEAAPSGGVLHCFVERAELHRLLGNLMAAELVAAMIRVTLK
jgi:hypothetical protein